MADFPTWEKNAAKATQEVDINPPAFNPNDTRSADQRWVDQQWRDADAAGLGKTHPLAINRDATGGIIASDPYSS